MGKMEGPGSREQGMAPKLGKARGLDAKELQILGSVISGGRYGLFVTLHEFWLGGAAAQIELVSFITHAVCFTPVQTILWCLGKLVSGSYQNLQG